MNNFHWLLEPDVFQKDIMPLMEYFEKQQIPYTTTKFGKPYEQTVAELPVGKIVFFLGSLQFVKVFQNEFKGKSGLFYNPKELECTSYYPRFGNFLLNENYVMLPFGDLGRRKNWLFDQFDPSPEHRHLFIRPNESGKSFAGQVISENDWQSSINKLKFRCNYNDLIVVASPVYYPLNEWRLMIVKGEIITGSQYRLDGENVRIPGIPVHVKDYAQQVLNSCKLSTTFTLDICEQQSVLNVVEIGSISCSGWYAADPEVLVPVLHNFFKDI